MAGLIIQNPRTEKERKKPLFTIFLLILFFSLNAVPTIHAQAEYWTIYPNVYFSTNDSGGYISFQSQVTTHGWYWNDKITWFRQITIGGTYWGELGFNCSTDTEMVVLSANDAYIELEIDAPIGDISISQVAFPHGKNVDRVEGVDSWSMTGNLLTASIKHTSPQRVLIYFAVITPFNTFRQMWGQFFTLIAFCAIVGLIIGLSNGDLSGGIFLNTIIGLVFGTMVVFLLLQVVENL